MRINFDAASGSDLQPAARDAYLAAVADGWGDPLRAHAEGRRAHTLLEQAREQVAAVLGCRASETAFDTSLSAAHRRAVKGLARGRARCGSQIVTSAVEHSAILHAVGGLVDEAGTAWTHRLLNVAGDGRIDATECAVVLASAPTAFIALQWANGEVATRQPVAEAAQVIGDVPLLVDGTAGIGYDDLAHIPWSVFTAGASHLGAPASCAVIAVREGVRWRAIDAPTDAYEHGWVPGMPNVAAVCSFAVALEQAHVNRSQHSKRQRELTNTIRTHVSSRIKDSVVLGAQDNSVPHTVTMSFLYVSGAALAAELDAEGFAVASGSACSSDALTPSHVLAAMGALTEGNIRVSLPLDATEDQVARFLLALEGCVARVRTKFGAPA